MSYDISFMIETFTMVATLLAIAFQLYLRHIDYTYTLVASGTVAGALLYDVNPLLSPFETIIKYENEAKDIFSSSTADWTIAHSSDSYQIEFRPTAQNDSSSSSSSGLFRLTAELDTNLSELELFEYLSVGKGLSLLYPVRISTTQTHLLTFSLDLCALSLSTSSRPALSRCPVLLYCPWTGARAAWRWCASTVPCSGRYLTGLELTATVVCVLSVLTSLLYGLIDPSQS